ncbi:MAG TPA: hypothetical protein VGO04_12495 [Ensifer sp.]|jgi:hypothetical protein|uniref:hypothetical protein n=1 Tax=Ensifer sp. TaxID=1872086 RepID=UPI002E1328F6|nr:hypothetical protein [Ensifer sp.]
MKKAISTGGIAALLAPALVTQVFASSEPGLDPTCAVVNETYAATRSSASYSAKVFGIENGKETFSHEYRVTENMEFERYADGFLRQGARKATAPLSYSSGPRFSSCKLVDGGTSSASGPSDTHYTAKWAVVPYTADVSIWLTADGKRVEKVKLRYHSSYMRPQPYPEVVEVFSYDNP